MTIPDKLLSVAGTAKTFLKNFSIPCVWVAVIAATPAGVIAWKVKGRLDRGDIEEARADKLKAQLALSDFTGQTLEKIKADTDRDVYMTADEAKEYGMIDEVITNRELAAVAPAPGVDSDRDSTS